MREKIGVMKERRQGMMRYELVKVKEKGIWMGDYKKEGIVSYKYDWLI